MAFIIRRIVKNIKFRRFSCSIFRQNFSDECENALNEQVNVELQGSYQYLAMAAYFSEASLNGAYKFFKAASEDETNHAKLLMEYIIKRGGHITLRDIPAPKLQYETLLDAMNEALKMEMSVNQSLLELHSLASKHGDPSLSDFIEENFLKEQVDVQKQLSDYVKQIELSQSQLGTYLFDEYLEKES